MSIRDTRLQSLAEKATRNDSLEYWFALPAILTLLALAIVPMIWSLYASFTDLNLTIAGATGQFVGIDNYIDVLTDDRFWSAMQNTAYYVGIGVLAEFVLGMAAALFMANYTTGRLTTVLFTVLLLPMMMAPIVAGYMWKLMLQTPWGPVNYLLELAGLPAPLWLSSNELSLTTIMIADIWQWTPFMILILYTGRITIDQKLYEAAQIDGASKWFAFRHVTLPQMKGVIAVAVLLRAMDAFKFFDKMFAMTAGGPGTSSELVTYTNYLAGFNDFAMGRATAMSWILVVVTVILANLFLVALERSEGSDDIA